MLVGLGDSIQESGFSIQESGGLFLFILPAPHLPTSLLPQFRFFVT
ncbi:hypothetical protein N0824_03404 [Microcystis sp. 0824]|nr:hypothetical protein N0824_03404 [Microcystis sp. 0824]